MSSRLSVPCRQRLLRVYSWANIDSRTVPVASQVTAGNWVGKSIIRMHLRIVTCSIIEPYKYYRSNTQALTHSLTYLLTCSGLKCKKASCQSSFL